MDERERGEIRTIFETIPCKLRMETLDIADYIISQEIAIERKRGDDLVASICDNRFFSQLGKLKKYYRKPLIILENPKKMFDRKGVYEASIYGAIIYAIYKMNIAIFPTKDAKETAETIWSFAKFVQKSEIFQYIPIKVEQEKISMHSQLFFLEGLFQVSDKKAKILLDHFKTPYKVLQAIIQSEITYSKSGKPKGISGNLEELKGFGHKFLKINKELLTAPF
jgi:Fanconi anemia group M protein